MSCPSSIRCRDSNSQPLKHESPPITTRPGPRAPAPFFNFFLFLPFIATVQELGQFISSSKDTGFKPITLTTTTTTTAISKQAFIRSVRTHVCLHFLFVVTPTDLNMDYVVSTKDSFPNDISLNAQTDDNSPQCDFCQLNIWQNHNHLDYFFLSFRLYWSSKIMLS